MYSNMIKDRVVLDGVIAESVRRVLVSEGLVADCGLCEQDASEGFFSVDQDAVDRNIAELNGEFSDEGGWFN